VAIRKSSGLDVELLEGRCLLSGSGLSLTLPAQGPTNLLQSAGTQSDDATGQRPVSTGREAFSSRPADESQRVDYEVMTRVLYPLSFTRDQPSILSASSALARLYGGDAGSPNSAATAPGQPSLGAANVFAPETVPSDVPAPVLVTGVFQGPKLVIVVAITVTEENLQPGILGKRPGPQAVTGEDDSPARFNLANVLSSAKDPSNVSSLVRDSSAALIQSVTPVSQPFTKDDRAATVVPASPSPSGNMNGFVTTFIAQGPSSAQFTSPNGHEPLAQDSAMAATAVPSRPDALEPPLTTNLALESIAAVAEPALPASSALLTNVLSVDFASLDSSVKSFFDQIDRIGVKLSESHVNLLFASGIVAAAGALAVEIARRKMQPAVPTVTLQREGSIPYSDFP
jgi:hypothetical protein